MNKVLREDRREWINETENEINPSFKLLHLQIQPSQEASESIKQTET